MSIREGEQKMPPLDPLVEMGLTNNLSSGWRGASFDLKKTLIIARAPTMLANHLPYVLDWKSFEQMKVMNLK